MRQNENNYYKGGQITCATYYKYLGIMYSSRICWTRANQTSSSFFVPLALMARSCRNSVGSRFAALPLNCVLSRYYCHCSCPHNVCWQHLLLVDGIGCVTVHVVLGRAAPGSQPRRSNRIPPVTCVEQSRKCYSGK